MQVVRGAASFALGQFAEHLQPEISEHYERVLPCIFTVLSDAIPDVQVFFICHDFVEVSLQQLLTPVSKEVVELRLDDQ